MDKLTEHAIKMDKRLLKSQTFVAEKILPKNTKHKIETSIKVSIEGYDTCQEITDISEQTIRHIIDLRGQQVKDALISIGWLPPEQNHQKELLEALEIVSKHINTNCKDGQLASAAIKKARDES